MALLCFTATAMAVIAAAVVGYCWGTGKALDELEDSCAVAAAVARHGAAKEYEARLKAVRVEAEASLQAVLNHYPVRDEHGRFVKRDDQQA